jgi:hypothetical protein
MVAHNPKSPARIYLAGKIAKHDWRHDLVAGLRGAEHKDGPLDCRAFIYVGPFFVACDHGCRHGPGTHGVAGNGCDGVPITRAEVFARNQALIASADLVFAYIDAPECYGTMVEIGWAFRAGIPIYLHFAPDIDHAEFWYVARMAVGAPAMSIVSHDDLPAVFAATIAEWKRR